MWLPAPALDCGFFPLLGLGGFSILDVIAPLQFPAFSQDAVVWRLPALLSPLLSLVSLHDPLSQSWP